MTTSHTNAISFPYLQRRSGFQDVIYRKILKFRLQQCAGSHQSIKGHNKKDADLVIILQWDESPLYIHNGSCYLKNSAGFVGSVGVRRISRSSFSVQHSHQKDH
jgi:hypothetical protein